MSVWKIGFDSRLLAAAYSVSRNIDLVYGGGSIGLMMGLVTLVVLQSQGLFIIVVVMSLVQSLHDHHRLTAALGGTWLGGAIVYCWLRKSILAEWQVIVVTDSLVETRLAATMLIVD